MVSIFSLWLPILVASVLVFVASSVMHMLLRYHRGDFDQLPSEDAVLEALRPFAVPPGDYVMPYSAGDPEVMRSEEFKEKVRKGPVAFMTVLPSDYMSHMGAQLTQWFIYCVVVSIFAAYIAGRALAPGAEYLEAFRFAGATAFVGYTLAGWQRSIWYSQKLSTTVKDTVDGLVYGLLTGGAFGWLWPS